MRTLLFYFRILNSRSIGLPLEKEMATHSSILAWRIPWTEKPGGLQCMGSPELDTTEVTKQQQVSLHIHPIGLSRHPRGFFNQSLGIWKQMGVSLGDIILGAEHLIIQFAEFCIYHLVFSTIRFILQLCLVSFVSRFSLGTFSIEYTICLLHETEWGDTRIIN